MFNMKLLAIGDWFRGVLRSSISLAAARKASVIDVADVWDAAAVSLSEVEGVQSVELRIIGSLMKVPESTIYEDIPQDFSPTLTRFFEYLLVRQSNGDTIDQLTILLGAHDYLHGEDFRRLVIPRLEGISRQTNIKCGERATILQLEKGASPLCLAGNEMSRLLPVNVLLCIDLLEMSRS